MSVLSAVWIPPSYEDRAKVKLRNMHRIVGMAKAADPNKRKSYRGSMGINPALEQKMIQGTTASRKSIVEDPAAIAAMTVANLSGPLDLEADLTARCVGAAIFRPCKQAYRFLVELVLRDDLWKWAKRGDHTMLFARLRPEQLQYDIVEARKLLWSPARTSDGDLAISFREISPERGITLEVVIRGPRGSAHDTAQDGGFHTMEVQLSADWPNAVPRARFTTPMYHCNICEDGTVPPGALGFLEYEWDASKSMFSYFGGLTQLLALPDPYCEEPARPDLAAQLRSDPFGYQEAVKAVVLAGRGDAQ